MPHRRLVVWLVVALVAMSGRAHGDGASGGGAPDPGPGSASATELVERMSFAMRTLDYEGTFVHAARGHLSSMHILHSTDARGELERLSALDGEAREVVRDHVQVTCVWPDSDSVVVTPSKPRRALPEVDASLASHPRYALELAGRDRVAGRDVHVVRIRPVDALRYGYRFWIDADTHMLLRSMLFDEAGQVLEEVLFTAIEYADDIDPSRFALPEGLRASAWLHPALESAKRARGGAGGAGTLASVAPAGDQGAAAGVDITSLPPGYRELGRTHRSMPIEGGPVSHVMISDGIASISVYVEHVPRSEQDTGAAGASAIGGVNAWGTSLERGFVTVVGEVPQATVRRIAEAVRLTE